MEHHRAVAQAQFSKLPPSNCSHAPARKTGGFNVVGWFVCVERHYPLSSYIYIACLRSQHSWGSNSLERKAVRASLINRNIFEQLQLKALQTVTGDRSRCALGFCITLLTSSALLGKTTQLNTNSSCFNRKPTCSSRTREGTDGTLKTPTQQIYCDLYLSSVRAITSSSKNDSEHHNYPWASLFMWFDVVSLRKYKLNKFCFHCFLRSN